MPRSTSTPSIADVAERAIVEHGGDRTRSEGSPLAVRDVGAEELDARGLAVFVAMAASPEVR